MKLWLKFYPKTDIGKETQEEKKWQLHNNNNNKRLVLVTF